MGNFRLIVGLILALMISSFGVVNMEPVTIAYYWGSIRLPLFYALLAFFACGFMAAWFGGAFDRIKSRNQVGKLEREVKALESNLDGVRESGGRLLPEGSSEPARPVSLPNDEAPQTAPAPRTSLPTSQSRTK